MSIPKYSYEEESVSLRAPKAATTDAEVTEELGQLL